MPKPMDIFLTALAPAIWGSSYLITTELLPDGYPLTVAMLRALPGGVVLLLILRQFPTGLWWLKVLVLGALNFSIFWWLLFVAAYRLPGGLAATVGAVQPLLVIFIAHLVMRTEIRPSAVIAAVSGLVGIALLTLTGDAVLDPVGLLAGVGGAVSMATGMVLTRHWKPPVSPLVLTSWQLTAGGLLLLPAALWFEPALPSVSAGNVVGIVYLGLIGAVLTYILWFRGVARIQPAAISMLGFLSPISAFILGWLVLDQTITVWQALGVVIVMVSILAGQFGLAPLRRIRLVTVSPK